MSAVPLAAAAAGGAVDAIGCEQKVDDGHRYCERHGCKHRCSKEEKRRQVEGKKLCQKCYDKARPRKRKRDDEEDKENILISPREVGANNGEWTTHGRKRWKSESMLTNCFLLLFLFC
jgi:hypothetical protein